MAHQTCVSWCRRQGLIMLGLLLISSSPALAQDDTKMDSLFQQMDKDFEQYSDSVSGAFQQYSESVNAAFAEWSRQQDSLFEAFTRNVDALWGDKLYPSRSQYVEYRSEFKSRIHIDFESGVVESSALVDSIDSPAAIDAGKQSVTAGLQESLTSPGIDEPYVVAETSQMSRGKPLLAEQAANKEGRVVSAATAGEFAREVVQSSGVRQDTVISADGKRRIRLTAVYSLVPDHLKKRGQQFLPLATEYASKYDLDLRLVMAIIHTESYFNPRATSQIPAFGLMQVVPKTAGRDAYQFVYGNDRLLTGEYLYDPEKNVELGCAYLHVVRVRYLKGITNDALAYPCMIASYNGGIGTVAKALTGRTNLDELARSINGEDASGFAQRLSRQLPYKETQDYLSRVLERMGLYDEWAK